MLREEDAKERPRMTPRLIRPRLLSALLVTLLLTLGLAAAPVAADSGNNNHISASGNYIQLSVSQSNVRQTGNVTHYDFRETDLLLGTVSGILNVTGQCMVRASGEGRCHARGEFVGSAAGRSGTAEFLHVFDVNLANFTMGDGHFTLLKGTGGLANLHGQGSFGGSIFAGAYSGKLHFAPNND